MSYDPVSEAVSDVVSDVVVAGTGHTGRWFMRLLRRKAVPPKPRVGELAPTDRDPAGHVKVRREPPTP